MTPQERVAKGAALLDLKYAGWADKINSETLYMDSCANCVVGQLLGSFDDVEDLGIDVDDSWEYGFYHSPHRHHADDYKELEETWLREINKRLLEAVASV